MYGIELRYLQEILPNSCSPEALMHLLSVLQCYTTITHIASPEIKLIIDERVSTVVFNKGFHLLKVSKGFEGEVHQ
jgi:hypothetical protein